MNGWQSKKLSEVLYKTENIDPRKNPNLIFKYVDVSSVCNREYKIKEVSEILGKDAPSRARKLIKSGDILFATIRPTLKRIAQVSDFLDGQICSTGYYVLRPKEIIYNRFLFYYLFTNDFMNEIARLQRGASYPAVNNGDITNQKIIFPPIAEQRRIVEILDEVFKAIAIAEANTKKNLANARELFDSYLNSALIKFVQGKTIQTLTDITELIIDCEHKTAPTQETGFPSIRTPNIGKGHLILDNVYRVSEKTYNAWTRRGKPQSGDLILAREAPAGNVGVIPKEEKVCLGQRTVLIRPKKDINSQYLAFFLLHSIMQKRLLSKSSGATVQHVNMKDIRALKISKFPSVEVQQKFVDNLLDVQSKSRQLEAIYQRKLEALAELKQLILQKAFTGQLPPL